MPPNPNWFKSGFLTNVEKVLQDLVSKLPELTTTDFPVAKEITESYAYFIHDCFPFFQRKFLLARVPLFPSSTLFLPTRKEEKRKEISIYFLFAFLPQMINFTDSILNSEPDNLINLKFDFMKIVCGYEHTLALNFPVWETFQSPFQKVGFYQKEFWFGFFLSLIVFFLFFSFTFSRIQNRERHYLAGWLLYEVSLALDSSKQTIRMKVDSSKQNKTKQNKPFD